MYTQMNLSKKPMDVTEFRKIADSKEFTTPSYENYDDLDRQFWRSVNIAVSLSPSSKRLTDLSSCQAPIYGADTLGTLFDQGVPWNLNELDTILNEMVRDTGARLDGVTSPYLYFGMWKT